MKQDLRFLTISRYLNGLWHLAQALPNEKRNSKGLHNNRDHGGDVGCC
jgi:hypothetical protein